MNKLHNIIIKFLLLAFVAGWGSSAWAERFTPEFEASYNHAGHWYTITSWTSGNYYAEQGDGANLTYGNYFLAAEGRWQLVGNQQSFVLVSKRGIYAKWNGTQYVGTTTAGEATAFSLIDMQGSRADYWGIHRNSASAGQVWNPQGGLIKEYNNDDNGSSVKFEEPDLEFSDAPVGDSFAAGTHWYTLRNDRSNSYLSTAAAFCDENGLKIRQTDQDIEPETTDGLWCFVESSTPNRYYIYNQQAGATKVLGTTRTSNDASGRTKLYDSTADEAGVNKLYEVGRSGSGYWIVARGASNNNWFLDDSKATYLTTWDHATNPKTSDGNRFFLSAKGHAMTHPDYPLFSATYDLNNGYWYYIRFVNGSNAYFLGDEEDTGKVKLHLGTGDCENYSEYLWQFVGDRDGFNIVNRLGEYMHWNGTDYELDENEPTTFVLDVHNTAGASAWELKNKDKNLFLNANEQNLDVRHYSDNDQGNRVNFFLATESDINEADGHTTQWNVQLTDAAGTVHQFIYTSDETDLHEAAVMHHIETPNATLTNYVCNTATKTVTADITFPFAVSSATVLNYTTIKTFNNSWYWYTENPASTNVKVHNADKSADLGAKWLIYPHLDSYGVFHFKVQNAQTHSYINIDNAAVQTGSNAPATAAAILTDEANASHFLLTAASEFKEYKSHHWLSAFSERNGVQNLGAYTATHSGTKLQFTDTAAPTVYPLVPSTEYTLDPASGSTMTGHTITLNISVDAVKNPSFVAADHMPYLTASAAPSAHRTAPAGAIVAESLEPTSTPGEFVITFGDVPGGHYTLTVPEGAFSVTLGASSLPSAALTADYNILATWQVLLTGEASAVASATVSYRNGTPFASGGTIDVSDSSTLPTDLKINGATGKFIWGPVIDDANKTITFDLRDVATSLSAGRWYQIQLLDRRGKYHGDQWSDNFYETLNNQTTITKKSNTLYVMNYPSLTMNTYPTEVSGIPVPEHEAYWSYVYLADVDASNNIAWQRPNGNYIKSTGENNGTTLARNWALTYNSADNSFAWNSGIMPWNNLGDAGYKHLALGYTSSGDQNATFQTYFHPVKSDEDYAIYKVVLSEGDVATYTGSANIFVADGGKLEFTETTINNGDYIFLPKGTTPTLSDFTFANSDEHYYVVNTTGDIWTLNMKVIATSYPLEPATEYTLDPVSETRFDESISNVKITITLGAGMTVRSAKEKNGSFTDDELPYLLPAAASSNHRASHKATPALAIVAKDVEETATPGEYSIVFDPAVTAVGHYSLVIPRGAFYVADSETELPTDELSASYYIGNLNELQFSDAPQNGQWAPGTKWFTLRNVNAKGYMNTAEAYIDESRNLKITNTADPVAASERGGAWCVVAVGANSYNIYNAAYGPDFILGVTGSGGDARVQMYPKDNVPSGVNTAFDFADNTNKLAGTDCAYGLHTAGGYLNRQSGYPALYGSNDGGSSFCFTRISAGIVESWAEYDVYQVVTTVSPTLYTSLDYTPTANTFGKRSTAKDGDYLILKHSAATDVANLAVEPSAEFAIHSATVKEVAGHYYKQLIIDIEDPLATEVYQVIILQPTDDHNAYRVAYHRMQYADGEHFSVRPDADMPLTAFTINNPDGKFIWGPVIDTDAKTVTFTIRNLATELTTGPYQLMLIDDDGAYETITTQIGMFPDNINTPSSYYYLMPSRYQAGGMTFKFSGVPSEQLVDGGSRVAPSICYIEKVDETNYILRTDGGLTVQISSLFNPLQFENGVMTVGWYGVSTDQEPLEMPAFGSVVSVDEIPKIRFRVVPADLSDIEAYRLVLNPSSPTTKVTLRCPTANGLQTFVEGDVISMPVGGMFQLSDFSPSDCRVLSFSTAAATDGTEINTLTLNIEKTVLNWKGIIKSDAGVDVSAYKVKCGGTEYAMQLVDGVYKTDDAIDIPAGAVPREVVSTTCADKFVWGPIVDEEAKTITFDIRPVPATLEPGFYQLMLIEDPDNSSSRSRANVAEINARIKNNGSSSINTTGSYIYVMPPYKETSYLAKYNGIPSYGDEPTTFFHITEVGTTPGKLSIQNVKGYYSHDGGRADKTATKTAGDLAPYTFNEGILGLQRWVPGGYWGNTTNNGPSNASEGPGVAAGDAGVYHEHYYITKVDLSNYDVYRLSILDASDNVVEGTISCESTLGPQDVLTGGYFFFPAGATVSAGRFKAYSYTFEGVSGPDAEGIKTITFRTLGVTNTILHRQHDVYDYIESIDPSLRPQGSAYIKPGEGMKTKTLAGVGTIQVQNTSEFEVELYAKQGDYVECVLPYTSGKDQGGSHISTYQRWYNYDTESRLADDVFKANGLGGFDSYDNGYVAKSSSNILSKALISFPEVSCLKVGVDCSDWTDSSIEGSNLIEPSLNMRVVYLIHDAKDIATKLAACPGSGTTYLENHAYYVPNVKNSSNVASNNIDLLPLDMAWSNYWMFDGSGTANENLVPLIGDTQELPDNFASETNGRVRVSTDRDDLLDVGVFLGQDGVDGGNLKYANANHFAWYKIKGPDGRRSVPNGTTAHVRVQINDGNGHWYNLAEYTLNFIADAEPLILTSVIGNPQSHRSTDYFISNNLIEVASLTFANPRVDFRTSNININPSNNQERTEKRKADLAKRTYAFPIDFSRTSYGYTHAHEFAEYKITTQGYGFKFNPVTLYEKNIKNPTSTQMEMPDDYYLYIDAAEQPGKVASIPFDGDLCPGSRLYCYGWMGSANRATTSSASVVLNVVERKGSTERVIASYLPGTMSNYAYDIDGRAFRSLSYGRTPTFEEGVFLGNGDNVANSYPVFGAWQQIGFNFYMPAVDPGATYELQIINNCYSTSGGDYCLDDFRVFVSPPTADVDFSTPLCNDDIAHIKIHTPYDLLSDADKDGSNYKVSYCFLDKEVYDASISSGLSALSGGATEEQIKAAYDAAFNAALMGNHTATDTPSGQKRSFWNMAVPDDFASIPPYTFSGTWNEEQVYSETVNNEDRVILVKSISDNTWKDNHQYYIAFKKGWIDSDFDQAASALFGLASGSACAFLREFTVKPSVVLNGDIDMADADALVACDGQTAAFNVVMNGIGPDGEVQKVNLEYDWWIGDGTPANPATVSAFLTAEHGSVKLNDALDHFRAYYTREASLQGVVPQSGPDLYGRDDHQLTQADIDCIAHFLLPDANGRVPLMLCKRNLNTTLRKAQAHPEVAPGKESAPDSDPEKYHYYIYYTIIPITPAQAFSSEDNAIFCPDPQQIRVRLNGKAPSMVNGFGNMTYPAGMDAIPVRAGIRQIEAVRLKAGSVDKVLRVPLRNVNTVYGEGTSFVIKQEKNGNYLDNIVLTSTDDPAYIDRVIVSNQDGQLEFLPIGKVSIYSAKSHSTNAFMQIAFAGTFQPREGYTYTLKCAFAEDVSGITIDADHPAPCPSSLYFDLKIVPEFQQWTYEAGNTDWMNDDNWARADRDALHADNATSEGARPLATYAANAINYTGDPTFSATDRKTAHGFVPMYFTNVLLYSDGGKADVSSEPAVNPARAPHLLAEGVKDTHGFLSPAGVGTATPLIQYDMLVTPIDDSNHPLSTGDIPARLAHTGNYGCELFWSNVCDGLTFEPGTMMYDAQHLQYNRVWVEYELETSRWYTLASPLKGTYAGEWYSPEDGGRQLTPHFYPVTYNPALNDRFNPAYYQRSWDKAGKAWIYRMAGDDDTYVGFSQEASPYTQSNVRVHKPVYLNWSYVYNDVAVDYSNGGFSVNAHYTDTGADGHLLNATGGKVLVRLPKDDLSYDYYQSEAAADYDAKHPAGGNGQRPGDANPDPTRPNNGNNNGASGDYQPQQGNYSTNGDHTVLPGRSATVHPRLMSDDLKAGSTIAQRIQNASTTNPYYLIGNPFMAPMNMDKFFEQQTCKHGDQDASTFEAGKYWILNGTSQDANIKVDGQWVSTSASNAGVVAPLQGFFVQLPTNSAGQLLHPDADATGASGVQLSFDENVQQPMTIIDEAPNGKPIFGYTGEDSQGQPIRGEKPSLKSRRRSAELQQPTMFRITATNGSPLESTAVVYFSDKASAHYDAREDAETLLDGNIVSKVSTVFTSADEQALQINTMPAGVTMIPVGVIAPKDDTRTTLCFTGLDALEAAMAETPHLYDAADGTLQVLDEGTTISVTGTSAGRYFIVSGTTLPVIDDNDDDNDNLDGCLYDLRGIRVNSVQHGTVTISRSRKEYNK